MEKNFCKKCGQCCKYIKVDFDKNIIYFDGIQSLDSKFSSMLKVIREENNISICSCKFLHNNLCINPEKPEICKKFPSTPFAYLPQDCGFEGDIFTKNEMLKQKIRKIKEEIIHYEALMTENSNKHNMNQYKKIIDSLAKNIKRYDQYGSNDW